MFAARQAALVLALCTLASASVAAAPQVSYRCVTQLLQGNKPKD